MYFDDDAWQAVLSKYNLKVINSTCKVCKRLCLVDCIECDECGGWFHYKCDNVNQYARKGKRRSGFARHAKTKYTISRILIIFFSTLTFNYILSFIHYIHIIIVSI